MIFLCQGPYIRFHEVRRPCIHAEGVNHAASCGAISFIHIFPKQMLWFAATEEMMVISRQFMSYNHMTQDISANHNVK